MPQNTEPNGTVAEQEKKNSQSKNPLAGIVNIGNDAFNTLGLQRISGSTASDFFEPIVGRPAGYAINSALAFGYSLGDVSSVLGLVNNILKEINENNDPNSPVCKYQVSGSAIEPEENSTQLGFDDALGICLNRSKIVSAVSATKNDFSIQTVYDLLNEINKPADPAECINPYFDQFFNLVPVQFIIAKLLRNLIKSTLENLSDQDVQIIINDVQPCGAEITKIYNNNLNIPEIPFPLFKLPAIPTIPNINLYTVLNKLIVEVVCYIICTAATPTLSFLTRKINDFLKEFLTEENIGAGSYTEFLDKSLGKLDLNQTISNATLNQAIIQGKVANYKLDLIAAIGLPKDPKTKIGKDGFWRQPTAEEQKKVLLENALLIRQYFKAIFEYKVKAKKSIYNVKEKKYKEEDSFRELGTKELIFLMLGEFNCFTIQDLIEIGSRAEFAKLRLDNEQRIKIFFSFIGNDIDPIALVSDLKKDACPPDPCEKVEQEVIEEVQNKISEMCKLLNLNRSGLPNIPVDKILKSVGLDKLFNQGIKQQFNQLKTEQLLYLGFPSLKNFPTDKSISNPFLPEETVDINDYEMSQAVSFKNNQELFKKYLLRGGPKLKWKYDDADINLAGSSLDDFCGEEETFEETFIHVFNEVFKIDLKKMNMNLESKKETYKNSFKQAATYEFDIRTDKAGYNPCCRFKNLDFIIEGATDDNKILPYLTEANISISADILVNKVKSIYEATDYADLEGIIYVLINQMTDEEKCYICSKPKNIKEDAEVDVKISLMEYLGSGSDLNEEEYQKVLDFLNCEKYGYVREGGAVIDFNSPAAKKSICK